MIRAKKVLAAASGDENISVTVRSAPLPDSPKVYEGKSESGRYLAMLINKESICDICHPVQFMYILDEKGKVVGFEPIYLTKRGNKEWSEENIEKMRRRVVGRSVLQAIDFNPEVDAVTSATITSAMIFRAIAQGKEILESVK
jgi:hypothetical protein